MHKVHLENWLAMLRYPELSLANFHQYLALNPTLSALPAWLKPNWNAVELDLTWASQPNNHIITLNDSAYPKLLKQISRPPAVLFVKGNLNAINQPQIAIVGSRNPTPIGLELGFTFSAALAKAGLTITSGLALGIDGNCHRGALSIYAHPEGEGYIPKAFQVAARRPAQASSEACTKHVSSEPSRQQSRSLKDKGYSTVAVLGHGLDIVYPYKHRHLADEITAHGALVSEFPIGYQPQAKNFPQRNRIISGLALGVIIVEAAAKSGSLITANFALEQGREVFALPGSIVNQKAKGSNTLIQQGAKLVMSPEDVLEELGHLYDYATDQNKYPVDLQQQHQPITKSPPTTVPLAIKTNAQQLLAFIGSEPTSVDSLIANSGFSGSDISGMLLGLELTGEIISVPGGYSLLKTS